MHRFLLVSALLLAFSASAPCQSQEELSQIKESILDEFDKRLNQKVATLRREMRQELEAILDKAGERMLAARGQPAPRPDRPVRPDRPATPATPARPVRPAAGGRSPFLGIKTRDLRDGLRTMLGLEAGVGVVVDQVREGSPAEKAGLKRNDVIVKVGGKAVGSGDDVRKAVGASKSGAELVFAILRRGQAQDVQVTLGGREGASTPEPGKKPDPIDALLDELLESDKPESVEPEADRPENPALPEGLRGQIPEQYQRMLETPEGRKLIEEQLGAFNQMLETPEGREMMMMQIEQMLDQAAGPEGMSDEDFDSTMELIEEFLERGEADRMRVIQGFMEMMQGGQNPLEGGRLEKLLRPGGGDETPGAAPQRAGFLGVVLDQLTDEIREERGVESGGVLLRGVHADGPAAKGGVEAGDLILSMDGKEIMGADSLVAMLRTMAPGTEVELHLVNAKGEKRKVKVELGVRPER